MTQPAIAQTAPDTTPVPPPLSFAEIETRIDAIAAASHSPRPDSKTAGRRAAIDAGELLALGEAVLAHWIIARGETPTQDLKEGFRLLALHRQGAKGEPSFNACRETARELAYHFNLVTSAPDHPETPHRLRQMTMVARHLTLFVGGKLEVAGLGEFCCSSKPVRSGADS